MKTLLVSLLGTLLIVSCAAPPPVVLPAHFIPAGSKLEFFGQIHDCTWKPAGCIKQIHHDMSIRELQQWAMSAATQRLGKTWRDYKVKVTTPQGPVVEWQRQNSDLEL